MKKKIESQELEAPKKKLIAKKDFKIKHNEYFFDIKEGDSLNHIPKMFIQNLKTEQVI